MPSEATRRALASTGSRSLDMLLGGGIPYGAVLLLAGNPGTGKTTLAAKILYEGLRRGEPALYLNFVEPREDFMEHMRDIGLDFEEYERKGMFTYYEALFVSDERALEDQLQHVIDIIAGNGVKRVAIDSLTAMLQLVRDTARVRELIQNFFVRGVKRMKALTVLIAEHPYGATTVGYGVEEFIVDAVAILRFNIVRGKVERSIEVRKIRWAPLRIAEAPFYIKPGVAVDVRLPEALEAIPPLDYEHSYDLVQVYKLLQRGRIVSVASESITGISPALRQVMRIPRGSQVIVTAMPMVTSRLIVAALSAGLLCLYPDARIAIGSLKTSPSTYRNLLRCIHRCIHGEEIEGLEEHDRVIEERVKILSINVTAFTLQEIADRLLSFIEDAKPNIVFLEGSEILEKIHGDAALPTLYNIMMRNKLKKITAFYIYTVSSRGKALEIASRGLNDLSLVFTGTPGTLDTAMIRGLGTRLNFEFMGGAAHVSLPLVLNPRTLLEKGCAI